MSEEIIKVFDYIGEKLGIAIDYTQENVMPYLEDLWNRYITYEIVTNILNILIGLILLVIGIIVFKKYFKSYKLSRKGEVDNLFYEKDLYYGISITGIGISALIFSISAILGNVVYIFGAVSSIIELLVLPEKYILEAIQTI